MVMVMVMVVMMMVMMVMMMVMMVMIRCSQHTYIPGQLLLTPVWMF